MDFNKLKKLKENATDPIIKDLINELAKEKGYIEINPELTLRTINQIIKNKHPFFKLIDCKLVKMDEGSMAMEYYYEIVFEDTDSHQLYGIKLETYCMVNGDGWNDYIENEGEDVYEVFKVSSHKVEIVTYKFENIKKKK